MPRLVATTSALARTHNVRAHALRWDQNLKLYANPFWEKSKWKERRRKNKEEEE